ncbi:MAG: DNA polymerase III subunit gamma/tau [Clostridia bacterium]|nr:DNA polymerase III subunit gamma/tau [Clostridia bacterium]
MYQVLYRKWRPRTFSEVIGQPAITAALQSELRTGRLAHAYLFIGSRGTGKTSCAKILAKAVNCLSPIDGDPCCTCDNCRAADDGALLDITEMDAASNRGIDDIRSLIEESAYPPTIGKYRVYIIDEVHELTTDAFNALLKTLEEPPAHVIFVLATTEAHKVPSTILSRCQRFDFGRIPAEEIAARLQYVASQESFSIDADAALLLARLADGGMRDALSMLDQCVSRSETVTTEVVTAAIGLAGSAHMFRLLGCMRESNTGDALALVGQLHESAKDMEHLCAEMTDFFRQLMICKTARDPAALLVLPPNELAHLKSEADTLSLSTILHAIDILQRAKERMHTGADRRVEMEMAAVKLCSPELDTDISALVRRIKTLEDMIKTGAVPAAAPTPVPATEPSDVPAEPETPVEQPPVAEPPAAETPAPPPASDEPTPFLQWSEVLDALSSRSMPLYSILSGSTAVIAGDRVLVTAESPFVKNMLSKDNHASLLLSAIRSVTGRSYRLGLKSVSAEEHAPAEDAEATGPLSDFLKRSQEMGAPIEFT